MPERVTSVDYGMSCSPLPIKVLVIDVLESSISPTGSGKSFLLPVPDSQVLRIHLRDQLYQRSNVDELGESVREHYQSSDTDISCHPHSVRTQLHHGLSDLQMAHDLRLPFSVSLIYSCFPQVTVLILRHIVTAPSPVCFSRTVISVLLFYPYSVADFFMNLQTSIDHAYWWSGRL